jgi:eukaryotic-like serine/threonine-protein kinase
MSAPERLPDFLSAACGGDSALREEVESLLEAHDEPGELFEDNSFGVASLFKAEGEGLEGKEFGRYKIVREIGRGGMGTVYLAQRDEAEYRRTAAVKVVRGGLETEEIARRFRSERQILAALDHPNIARLLDGGTTDDGLPYLVMEYVEGTPITEYCDQRRLSTNERLELFRTVCAAVQHAHQNLVVHRDLKPSNILITTGGVPKLLDFGIAKVLHPGPSATPLDRTRTELRMLTPEYASPEQVRGEAVTTVSDVYSLGVILYELLSGHRPYRTAGTSPHELNRIVCEQEPAKPSTIVNSVEVTASDRARPRASITPESVSRVRDTEPDKLRRRLLGDLDNIVLTALRKEPQRRYASAAQFSEDIRRHLEGLPVLAHKDTFGYRAGKFVRRNKIAVGAAALLALSLVGGLAFSTWQYRNARRERARAEAVNQFLQTMLATGNPAVNQAGTRGRETTINDVLDIASRRLESEDLSNQPEVKAELQWVIGASYQTQGRYDLAEKNLRAALAAQTRLFGESSPETLKTLVPLAALSVTNADYTSAEQFYDRRLSILRAEHRAGRLKAGVLLSALNDFALVRRARGSSKEAEALLREAVALRPQIPPEGTGSIESVEAMLAVTLLDQGKFDEVEVYARNLIAGIRGRQNSESQGLCSALTLLGSVLMEKGALDEAEANLREAEALYRKLFDPNLVAIYDNVRLQAQTLYLKGSYAEAEARIEQTLENYRQNSKPQYINFATALTVKGLILNKRGRSAEGERVLREAMRLRDENLPREHFMSALTRGALGEILQTQRRFVEAEPLLLESYETLKLTQATENPRTISAKRRLHELYAAWGKPELLSTYR